MLRNAAVADGRPIKNEDLTRYIQAFSVIENMLIGLGHTFFIVSGCTFTPNASNFDISDGVVFADGELCIFDAVTNVSFPYTLRKETIGVFPRQFFDSSTKNTVNKTQIIADSSGIYQFDSTTKRANSAFLRSVTEGLRGDIDANNLEISSMYKSNLHNRFQQSRVIPAPTQVDKYLKIGDLRASPSESSSVLCSFSGCIDSALFRTTSFNCFLSLAFKGSAFIDFKTFVLNNPSANVKDNIPSFFYKHDPSEEIVEIWIKSSSGASPDFTDGVIEQCHDYKTDSESSIFEYSASFVWVDNPGGLSPFVFRYLDASQLQFAGNVSSLGALNSKNGGILNLSDVSVSKISTGRYRITHNLNNDEVFLNVNPRPAVDGGNDTVFVCGVSKVLSYVEFIGKAIDITSNTIISKDFDFDFELKTY